MAVVTLKLPTDEEEELLRRFTVNRHYLQAIAGFVTGTYGYRDQLYSGLKTTLGSYPPYTRINRATADIGEVRRFLTLAWTSEIQLHLPALMGNTAMLGFANAWAPVHAYYAVFGALQAWFAANGMSGTANDHTATLKTIASQIEQRDLFPEPWNLLAVGCPMRDEKIHLNERGRDCTSHIEVLTIPAPFGVDRNSGRGSAPGCAARGRRGSRRARSSGRRGTTRSGSLPRRGRRSRRPWPPLPCSTASGG